MGLMYSFKVQITIHSPRPMVFDLYMVDKLDVLSVCAALAKGQLYPVTHEMIKPKARKT